MSLLNKIQDEMKVAMKEKDKATLSTLRLLMATVEKKRIESKETEVTDEMVETSIKLNVKKLDQEIEALQKVKRDTSSQEIEKEVLSKYLPKLMTKEETEKSVQEIIDGIHFSELNMGTAMKRAKDLLTGKADMKLVSSLVKQALNK